MIAAAFPFVSTTFHHPRLRPSCPRRASAVLPARATGPSSSWEEREEARWLREEQRWLREEQRWLREESRWRAEHEALLAEAAALRLRLRTLEGTRPADHLAVAADAVVASPAPPAAVPALQPRPVLVEEAAVEVRKEVVVVEEKKVAAAKAEAGSGAGASKSRRTLRAGAEGEDVRAMQEALLKLGFYSGEEDMEYSTFSSGTERAVKTWQATVGTSENGVMTSELLERLFSGKTGEDAKMKIYYGKRRRRKEKPFLREETESSRESMREETREPALGRLCSFLPSLPGIPCAAASFARSRALVPFPSRTRVCLQVLSLGTRDHHRPGHGVLLRFVVKQHRGCEAGDRRRSGHGVLLCQYRRRCRRCTGPCTARGR